MAERALTLLRLSQEGKPWMGTSLVGPEALDIHPQIGDVNSCVWVSQAWGPGRALLSI